MRRPDTPSRATRSRAALAFKALAALACVALLARVLGGAEWSRAAARLGDAGPAVLLVLLPFSLAVVLDATAWGLLLRRLGQVVPLARLVPVRTVTEAVTIALPGGALIGEVLGPLLLADDAPVSTAFTSSTAKRWLIIRTHGLYVCLAALAGFGALAATSRATLGRDGLPWIALASAAGLVALSFGVQRAATRHGLAARLHAALARLRASRAFAWADRKHVFEDVDAHLARLGRGHHLAPAALLLGAWLLESVETWVILSVLGAHVPFHGVLAIEASLSVVRSAVVVAPAGLGVQDAGYLTFLETFGVPEPAAVGPAFVVLKRAKELVFVLLGAAVLLLFRRARAVAAPHEAGATPEAVS